VVWVVCGLVFGLFGMFVWVLVWVFEFVCGFGACLVFGSWCLYVCEFCGLCILVCFGCGFEVFCGLHL